MIKCEARTDGGYIIIFIIIVVIITISIHIRFIMIMNMFIVIMSIVTIIIISSSSSGSSSSSSSGSSSSSSIQGFSRLGLVRLVLWMFSFHHPCSFTLVHVHPLPLMFITVCSVPEWKTKCNIEGIVLITSL